MRAKSIKNKARVNAELSPAELKALLKKAQRDGSNAGAYIGLLEQEVGVWRSGGTVDQAQWASMERALGLKEGELEQLVGGGGAGAKPKPKMPALDRVSDGGISRPETPTGSPMDNEEREEFLRRQNEMEDQLAKAVRPLSPFFPAFLSRLTDDHLTTRPT
jgi:kinesin family protein 5